MIPVRPVKIIGIGRVVVGEVPGRRRHGGAGLRTCERAA